MGAVDTSAMNTHAASVANLADAMHVPGFLVTPGRHEHGSMLPRHWHDVPTICHVVHGRFVEYRRGRAVECRTGAVHVMPAGETHWNRFAWGETRGVRIDIAPSLLAEHPVVARLLAGELLVDGGVPAQLVRRVLAELASGDEAAPLAVEGLLLELLAALARASRRQSADNGDADASETPWLRRARELLHDDAAAALSLSSVAMQVGVHPVTLARSWRRAFGCSLGESLRRIRIERAARALVETSHSLSEIAQAAGFYDQSHFTHTFRRLLGETPGTYRARRVGRKAGSGAPEE